MTRDGDFQNLAEAKRLLEKANELKPQNPEILVALGRVNEKEQDLDKARKCYQEAVDSPLTTNVNAYFYLGVVCEKQKDF